MAEALGIVGVLPAAVKATTSLAAAVQRYMDRDKTLRRLHHEVADLSAILSSLQEFIDSDAPILLILRGPVSRCGQVCREFEDTMQKFSGKSKTGLRDWARMEFARGDINTFMETLANYKSTIMVGLGTLTMSRSKLAQEALEAYGEMVQDTTYNLKLRLQRIEEVIAATDSAAAGPDVESNASVDLQDEREVTRQCLRICQDAQAHIESLQRQQPLPQQPSSPLEGTVRGHFEAELKTSQVLNGNRDSLVQTISYLQQRLASVITGGDERERSQKVASLLEDINVAKQCLEVCREASNQIQLRKIHVIGEVIADDDTDQVVITTLADLFDVKKVMAKNRTTQLVGSMSDETAQKMFEGRPGGRSGSRSGRPSGDGSQGSSAPTSNPVQDGGRRSAGAETGRTPSPNEVRKRAAEGEGSKPPADR